jgi:hypothetical protein
MKILKNNWVCVHPDGTPWAFTISGSLKGSKENFLSGSTMTWRECKKSGWTCVKVDIQFNLVGKVVKVKN